MGAVRRAVEDDVVRLGVEAQRAALMPRLTTGLFATGGALGAGWAVEAIVGGRLVGVAAVTAQPFFQVSNPLGELLDGQLLRIDMREQVLHQRQRSSRSTRQDGIDLFSGAW